MVNIVAQKFLRLSYAAGIALIALMLLWGTMVRAQGVDPAVTANIPDGVAQGSTANVTLNGANFVEPYRVTLVQINSITSTINSVTPPEFWNKQNVELAIEGPGLSSLVFVDLGGRELEQWEIVSPTAAKVIVPAGFDPGEHTLVLSFDNNQRVRYETPIVVHPYITPQITSTLPSPLYNNEDRPVAISGQGFADLATVFLGDQPLPVVAQLPEVFMVTVTQGFTAGNYALVLEFKHGERLTHTEELVVRDPISAEIASVDPRFLVSNEATDVLITGTGVSLATSAYLSTASGRPVPYGILLLSPVAEGDGQKVMIEPIDDSNASPNERYVLGLGFPDDTDRRTEIVIYRSLIPLTGDWFWLALILGAMGYAANRFYNITLRSTANFKSSRTAPGGSTLLGFIIGTMAFTFILGLVVLIFWWLDTGPLNFSIGQIRFLVTWLLAGLTVFWAGHLVHWTGYFGESFPRSTRITVALALSLLALALPFLLNRAETVRITPWLMLVVALLTVAAGWWGSWTVQRRLAEERRKGPGDQTILLQVEQVLYRQGQVSATEDFSHYPEDRVKKALETYLAGHRDKQNLYYDEQTLRLSFQRSQDIALFNEKFTQLDNFLLDPAFSSSSEEVKEAARSLMEVMQLQLQFLSGHPFPLKQAVPPDFALYSLRSKELESVLPTPFPFVLFLSRNAISADQLEALKQLQNELNIPSRFAVLFTIGAAGSSRSIIQQELGSKAARENVVVLDGQDWRNILADKQNVHLAFMEAVQAQVDLAIFSPYQVKGPTNTDMCYGRNDEIAQLVETISNSSFAILGARRIGKTSVLRKIQQILGERGRLLLYLDCYSIHDYVGFFNEIETYWQPCLARLAMKQYKDLDGFSGFVTDLKSSYPDKHIVFQFDEIDRLLNFDAQPENDELLFRRFRSLAQQQKCQFLFSGERTIIEKLPDPQSSFFNFVNPIRLSLLDQKSAGALIQEPMKLVGVTLKKSDRIVDMIYEATAGHPNLIQIICHELLENLSASRSRVITPEMVTLVIETPEFRDRYVEVFKSQANPMEQAMAVLVCSFGPLSEHDFRTKLRQAGFEVTSSQIKHGLEYLKLSHLFTFRDGKYEIKPTKFVEAIDTSYLDEVLQDYLQEWKKLHLLHEG